MTTIYSFTYYYSGDLNNTLQDYYEGFIYAPDNSYTVGDYFDYSSETNEAGFNGKYYIHSEEIIPETRFEGYVALTNYYDSQTGLSFDISDQSNYFYELGAEFGSLGSEYGSDHGFGYDSAEANVIGKYNFTYYYSGDKDNVTQDYYTGHFYALGNTFAQPEVQAQVFHYNGNSYAYIYSPSGITWEDARLQTGNIDYNGVNGHLVTVTSEEENEFIYSNILPIAQFYDYSGPWIGATDQETEGVWQWVTGETWNYISWAVGQPDNYNGTDNFAYYNDTSWKNWNDYGYTTLKGYIVEFEGTASLGTANDVISVNTNKVGTYWDNDSSPNETGYNGRYFIESVTFGEFGSQQNQVVVNSYYDMDTGYGQTTNLVNYVSYGVNGYYGLGSEADYATDTSWNSADSYFNYYSEADILYHYQRYEFTYEYGNGDYYTGWGYAPLDTYTVGILEGTYDNETGNEGFYSITAVGEEIGNSTNNLNNYVYVSSYYDSDTGYGFADILQDYYYYQDDGIFGYSGLGSESGYAYDANGNASDSYFSNSSEADILYRYQKYEFTYEYGNGDYYTGYGYAPLDTYTVGILEGTYENETGNQGFYSITAVGEEIGNSTNNLNNYVYVSSYYDSDTGYGFADILQDYYYYQDDGIFGYSGLGSESGYAYDSNGNSSDPYFSNTSEADIAVSYLDRYSFTYSYGNGDYYTGVVYAVSGTYELNQIINRDSVNETGFIGSYEITNVEANYFSYNSGWYNYVEVKSYYDSDTDYGFADYAYASGNNGLGSESGTIRGLVGGVSFTDNFDNYNEADLEKPQVEEDDQYEDNDDIKSATPITGNLDGLIIVSNDPDWFTFELSQRGTVESSIKIEFSNSLGDLDLVLYNEQGSWLGGSYSYNDEESISLNGLVPGTYYAQVFGWAGASNPEYNLKLNLPSTQQLDDWFDEEEGNDTFDTAYNIGRVTRKIRLSDILADITPSNTKQVLLDDDYYSFELGEEGKNRDAVGIVFDHARGDLELELYNSSNELVGVSSGVGNSENISLRGLSAGSYIVRVFGYNGATNPGYDLTIVTALDGRSEDNDDKFDKNGQNNDTRQTAATLTNFADPDLAKLVLLDNDWYKFTTNAVGRIGDQIRLDFNHILGDIDLEVYTGTDADNLKLKGESYSIDNYEAVSMVGWEAGTYWIRVFGYGDKEESVYRGDTNPEYKLTIKARTDAVDTPILPDRFEVNNTLGTATVLRQSGIYDSLTIHKLEDQTLDQDWFSFTLSKDGTINDYIQINFDHGLGNLDLLLFGSNQETSLRTSTGLSNLEFISLNGLVQGTYWAKVEGKSTSPNYSLTLQAPLSGFEPDVVTILPDWAEANDDFGTAYNLATYLVSGATNSNIRGEQSFENLNVHEAGNDDWFKLTSVGNGDLEVTISFDHSLGDLDLEIYDSNQQKLSHSLGNENSESVKITATAQAEYFIRVFGEDGQNITSPNYSLRISAPRNEPERISPDIYEVNDTLQTATVIRNLSSTITGLTIHNATDPDWFKFESGDKGQSQHQIFLEYGASTGELLLKLYDSTGQEISVSSENGVGREVISLENLEAGTYYAEVLGVDGATNPNYSLTLNAPVEPEEQPLPTWTIFVYMAADNNLEQYAIKDINEMEFVNLPSNVKVVVQVDRIDGYDTSNGDWTDTRRGLIQHDSDRDIISSNLTSVGELNMGDPNTLSDFLNWGMTNYASDNYAVILWNHGGGLSGVAWDETGTKDNLTQTEIKSAFNTVNMPNLGLIGFDACLMGLVEQTHDLAPFTDVIVGAQQIEPGDGWSYDGFLTKLAENPYMTSQDLGSAIVDSYGTYYNNTWTLAALDVTEAKYNSLKTAIKGFVDVALASEQSDWAKIGNARNRASVHDFAFPNDRDLGSFVERIANANVSDALKTAANNVLTALNDSVINKVGSASYSGLGVYLPAPSASVSSTYNSNNFGWINETGWDQFLSRLTRESRTDTGRAVQDDFETQNRLGYIVRSNNDDSSVAVDLGSMTTSAVYNNLSITEGDQDWYYFDLPASSSGQVTVTFNHDLGDLKLELFDAQKQLQQQSNSSSSANGTEVMTFSAQGTTTRYFLRVSGADAGVVQRNYSLKVEPTSTGSRSGSIASDSTVVFDDFDRNGNNNIPDKATNIGSLGNNELRSVTGLTITSGDKDWFVYDPSRITTLNPNTITISGYTGDLTLTAYTPDILTNPNATPLATSARSGASIQSVSFGSVNTPVYVRVEGADSLLATDYELNIARRNLDINGDGVESPEDYLLAFGRFAFSSDEALQNTMDGIGLITPGSTRVAPEDLDYYLTQDIVNAMFDVNADGLVSPEDYLLAFAVFSFSNDSDVDRIAQEISLFPDGSQRTTASEVRDFLSSFNPVSII
ncbi:clostripain-related cysteine peptidase [Geminocystis sp. CENA526]|uniref:clostripain-related cysteine peptidase n=1 Tax=Geminocystis sp. CENA526 TaxID=1355871 RepID=UPI003D70003C